jgi:hypothetical protein
MESPRQTPDRLFRESLPDADNLREFLESALPDEVANFDFTTLEEIPREFFAGDWREREADLIFQIKYRLGGASVPALVGILIEHQTNTDPFVPLRALFLLVSFWERKWREWEQAASPKPEVKLPPAFSVVLYTADRAWGSCTTVRELLGEPASLHPYAPDWGPVFWNLSERTAEALLRGPAWMQLMAVVRATDEEREVYERVLTEAFRHLGPVNVSNSVRWSRLFRAILSYSRFRRPEDEWPEIQKIADREYPTHAEEVRTMFKTITQADEERGAIKQARTSLRLFLEGRFGTLPEEITQRIEALDELDKLNGATRLASQIGKLDDFQP